MSNDAARELLRDVERQDLHELYCAASVDLPCDCCAKTLMPRITTHLAAIKSQPVANIVQVADADGKFPTNPATTTTVTMGKNSSQYYVTKDLVQHCEEQRVPVEPVAFLDAQKQKLRLNPINTIVIGSTVIDAAEINLYDQSTIDALQSALQKTEAALVKEIKRADAWVRAARDLARELGTEDEDSNGSIHDWRDVKLALKMRKERAEKAEAALEEAAGVCEGRAEFMRVAPHSHWDVGRISEARLCAEKIRALKSQPGGKK